MPEVGRPRRRAQIDEINPELSMEGPKLGAKVTFSEHEETLQDRAERATSLLRSGHQVGGFSQPDKPYLRIRLDAYMATFNVAQGWEWGGVLTDTSVQSVMLLAASQVVAGQRVFVGLIGSAHNLLARGITNPVSYTQGRTPSDINGFYDLFQQIREREDAKVHKDRAIYDRRMSDLEVAREVMALAQGSPGDGPPRRVEVLLKRHRAPLTGHVILDDEFIAPYNLVIIGAPVWIREVQTSDGSPALPRMDAVGPDSHTVFSARRRELVKLAEAATAKNHTYRNLQDQFEKLGGRFNGNDVPSAVAKKRALATDIIDLLRARDSACAEYNELEAALLAEAEDVTNWPIFAEWFTTQACLDGVPLAYLHVERKDSWWRRVGRRNESTPTLEQMDIAGVVVTLYSESDSSILANMIPLGTYRDAQSRDHRFPGIRGPAEHVMVTPSGELYPVSISSFRNEDRHARVILLSPQSEKGQLRRCETPSSDPSLKKRAARAMLEMAMRWRVTLNRSVPEAPWLHDESRFALMPRTHSSALITTATIPAIEAMLRETDTDQGGSQPPAEGPTAE